MRRVLIALLALGMTAAAGAATVAKVDVPDTANVAGIDLVLNGAGLRTKYFIKIYVGALYVGQKSDDPDAIMAQSGPDRVLMHMIYAVSKQDFSDAWSGDFAANNPDSNDALKDRIAQFIAYFGDSKKDDIITIDYVPGQGTQISWNGAFRGNIPGEDFHKAFLKVFLGPKPPTNSLKDGMLGKG